MEQEPHTCRHRLIKEGQGTLVPYLVSASRELQVLHFQKFWKQLDTHCFLCQSRPGRRDLLAFWDPMALLREHSRAIQAICGGSRKGMPGGSWGGQGRVAPRGARSFFAGGSRCRLLCIKKSLSTLKVGSHQNQNTKNRQTRQLIFPSKPTLPRRKERFSFANSERSCGWK